MHNTTIVVKLFIYGVPFSTYDGAIDDRGNKSVANGPLDGKSHDWKDPDLILARANRLKVAVKSAGGSGEVSRKASMSSATLGSYLAGRDMTVSALVSLATACEVSILWLCTGRGKMHASEEQSLGERPIEMLRTDAKDELANFHLLASLLLTCREFFEKSGMQPSLETVLDFVSPHYILGRVFWQDKHFKIVDLEDAA